MRAFLFFSALLLIASCDVNNSDSIYPFTEQMWSVESGERAAWLGSQSHGKIADSTIVDDASKYALDILQHHSSDSVFVIQFTDSTHWSGNDIEYPYVDTLFGAGFRTVNTSFFSDHVITSIHFPYDCGVHDPVDTLNIVYAPYQQPEDTVEFYQIAISGALETVDHIICGS